MNSAIKPRRVAAVNAGKLTAVATRLLRRGGGTAIPGVVAAALDPDIARALANQLARGSVVVSGTNGKTTTCRMLAAILQGAGLQPIRNESGSNLMRGLTSSLVQGATVAGNMPSNNQALGVFEVDEAALPGVLRSVVPHQVLLLDLFRDQLDRYGEVATIARLWSAALAALPHSSSVVVNADDPLLAEAISATAGHRILFGIQSADRAVTVPEHASDVKACPRCGGPIRYETVFLGHLGHYACSNCDFRRPKPDVIAAEVRLRGVHGSDFLLTVDGLQVAISLPLPGMYNVYNAVGAATAAAELGIPLPVIASCLSTVTPAFGRMERLEIEDRNVYLALAKNPAGLNEVLRTLAQDGRPLHLLVMLNDNTADGHDVSWIWDADIEMVAGQVASAIFGGTRAADMALRFKYAGVIEERANVRWEVAPETRTAFEHALAATPSGSDLFVIPTYTAMLDIRDTLARLGHVRQYWEQ